MLKRTIFCILHILFSFLLVMFGSVHAFIVDNEKSIPTGIILPSIDPNTTIGFLINAALQGVVEIIACSAVIGFNIFINIMELTIHHLRNFIENITNNCEQNIHQEFFYISITLEDIKNFIDLVNEILYWIFILQPVTLSVCVSIGIFCQYMVIFWNKILIDVLTTIFNIRTIGPHSHTFN